MALDMLCQEMREAWSSGDAAERCPDVEVGMGSGASPWSCMHNKHTAQDPITRTVRNEEAPSLKMTMTTVKMIIDPDTVRSVCHFHNSLESTKRHYSY